MRYALTLFPLLGLISLQAIAEIYKCSDDGGTVQYTDKPCTGHYSIITPAAAPVVDAYFMERRQRADKLLRAYDEEHAEEQRALAEAKAALLERQQECARARGWLAQVTSANTLYRVAEDGSRVNLNDAELAAVMAKAKADVTTWCD